MQSGLALDRASILDQVVGIVADMTADWDLEPSAGIRAETLLIADLCFESIDIVQFVVALEERFGRRGLPFEKLLMADGRYVDDVSVAQVADFLHDHLGR